MRRGKNIRSFIMLKEADKGFGKTGKPTGYAKLELKKTGGKVLVHVQNIGALGEEKVLKAYLLSGKARSVEPFCIGTVEVKDDYGDIAYELKQSDLQRMGADIHLMDTVVIVCKDITKGNQASAYPLVGFKNEEWHWRDAFAAKEKTIKNNGIDDTIENDKHRKINLFEKETELKKEEIVREQSIKTDVDDKKSDTVESLTQNLQEEKDSEEKITNHLNQNVITEEKVVEEKIEKNLNQNVVAKEEKVSKEKNQVESKEVHFIESQTEIKEKKDGIKKDSNMDKTAGDFNHLIDRLSGFMAQDNPFEEGDKGYQWWVLNDLRFLLDQYSRIFHYKFIQNVFAVVSNLQAANAVRRYRHYLLGIKKDAENHVKYIAYAIPSRYGLEPHPLLQTQAYAHWVPQRGQKCAAGALGYWLVTINVRTGELVLHGEEE